MLTPTLRRIARRIARPAALLVALPFVIAPGQCGFALDFTETFLVTDPVHTLVIIVDDGNLDAVAYEREAILLKRHTFGFQASLGDPKTSTEDGVLSFEVHCKYEGNCTFDHLFELPLGVGFDITMSDANIDIGYVDADIKATFETGRFTGVRLQSPTLALTARSADIDIDFAAPPQSATIELDDGSVALAVPAGAYRCRFVADDGQVTTSGITCDDAATQVLDVHVQTGDITVTESAL